MKNRIKSALSHLKADCLLVSDSQNIYYLTDFSGFSNKEREAYLLLTKRGNFIFTDNRYSAAVKKHIPDFKLVEINHDNSFEKEFSQIIKKLKIKTIAANLNNLNISEYKRIRKHAKLLRGEANIEKLREVKDKKEIINLIKSSSLGDKTFNFILKHIKKGASEIEIAKKIEIFILENNATTSFPPIVAFGTNSAFPHHTPTNKKLKKNSIVLLDFGVKVNGYCSDMSRTIYFGKADTKFKKIYNAVLDAQTKAIESLTLGQMKASEIDKIARDYIISLGFSSIPHSLGHGIGIDVHEAPSLSPKSKQKLSLGNVFSIEPGIYIERYGGVRIEDLVLLTNKGPVLISRARSEIIEL